MTKLLKKKSKSSIIKAKKQQLCDRINQCKNLEELKGWEKTFSYYDVLKDDFDWDEGFFFDLIEFKLKRMSQYFHIVFHFQQYYESRNILSSFLV